MKTYVSEMRYFYIKRNFFFGACEDVLPNDQIPYSHKTEYNFEYYDSVMNAVDDQVMIALTGGFPEY